MFTHVLMLLSLAANSSASAPDHIMFHDEAACVNALEQFRQATAYQPSGSPRVVGICAALETTIPPIPAPKPKAKP